MAGFVNVDAVKQDGVDVVHDLDVGPWPFDDGAVKQIQAIDVFEHVAEPVLFMTESHRVLEPGGMLIIKAPHYKCRDAFTDPTHRRFPTEYTWDYWIPGTALFERHNAAYGAVSFDMVRREVFNGAIHIQLLKKPA
jgi:cyclopropane fatty-acyl-phospholipid synthase-like methyltransferase